jgi:hypothetical protein
MRKACILFFALLISVTLLAQSSLYIAPGATVYITAGATVAADGLVLTPTAGFALTGTGQLTRQTSLIHTSHNPHILRVYNFTNTTAPFSGTISVYYHDGELNGLDENALTLNVHNGTSWNAYNTSVTRDATGNVVTTTALSAVVVNELTLASESLPLPLRWLKVEAVRRGDLVHINWRTANETNCELYHVQRSTNGRDWQETGSAVAARNEAGPNDYQLTDMAVPASLVYYRIRQKDRDGRITYSIIVLVSSDQQQAVLLYPNPVADELSIVAKGGLQLVSAQVYNAAGMLVGAENINHTILHTLPVNRLAAGVYTVHIRLSDGTFITRSFIKQ